MIIPTCTIILCHVFVHNYYVYELGPILSMRIRDKDITQCICICAWCQVGTRILVHVQVSTHVSLICQIIRQIWCIVHCVYSECSRVLGTASALRDDACHSTALWLLTQCHVALGRHQTPWHCACTCTSTCETCSTQGSPQSMLAWCRTTLVCPLRW